MDETTSQKISLGEAIAIAEGYHAVQQNSILVEKFFEKGLNGISPEDTEKKAQYYYYLLKVLLKRHVSFENPLLVSYYQRMEENLLLTEAKYKHELQHSEGNRKKSLLKTQLKAFYKISEGFLQSLEKQYRLNGFEEAGDRAYERYMGFRKKRTRLEGKYTKYIALLFMEITSNYGLSLFRWGISAFSIVLIFALLYLLEDKITAEKLITSNTATAVDYIYFSINAFASLGLGSVEPLTAMQKIVVGSEVISGYFMMGLLLHLMLKRV